MKIIGFKDLDNGLRQPVVLPETSVVRPRTPLFVPAWSEEWIVKPFIGVVIDRLGKAIQKKFASRYWKDVVLVLKAAPTTNGAVIPEGFDGSLLVSEPLPLGSEVTVMCETLPQRGETSKNLYSRDLNLNINNEDIDESIAYASQYFTLHTGDMILLPMPSNGDMELLLNSRLICESGTHVILNHKIK